MRILWGPDQAGQKPSRELPSRRTYLACPGRSPGPWPERRCPGLAGACCPPPSAAPARWHSPGQGAPGSAWAQMAMGEGGHRGTQGPAHPEGLGHSHLCCPASPPPGSQGSFWIHVGPGLQSFWTCMDLALIHQGLFWNPCWTCSWILLDLMLDLALGHQRSF